MSVLVAIEASTGTGSVAIGRGGELIGEVVIGMHTRHAQALLPALDFLLRTAAVERSDIGGIIVGAGPGSFTGVRIAAATARGLALGLGVPFHAWSSLAALALDAAAPDVPVCALFDARRGEVYAACYRRAGTADRLTALIEPAAMRVTDVVAAVSQLPAAHVVYAGDGARRYAAELGHPPAATAIYPRASALLRLAAAEPARGRVDSPAGWEPEYLRASGAERMGSET